MKRVVGRSAPVAVGPAVVTAVAIVAGAPAVSRLAAGWGLAALGAWTVVLVRRRAVATGEPGWRRLVHAAVLWTTAQVVFAATPASAGAAASTVFALAAAAAAHVVLRSPQVRQASTAAAVLDALSASIAVGGLLWSTVLTPAATAMSTMQAVPFPLVEVAVVGFGISVLTQSASRDRALLATVASFGVLLVGDVHYLYDVGHGGYRLGGGGDSLWAAGLGVMALLACTPGTVRSRRRAHWWHQAWSAVPLVVLAARALHQQVEGGLETSVAVCGVTALLAFVVRQLVLHHQIVALSDELAEDRDRLAAAEERARLLLEYSGDGVIGTDPDGTIVFLNRAAEELLHLAPGEGQGRRGHELVHQRRPDGTAFSAEACPIGRAIRRGEAVAADLDWWTRTDGTFVPVEYRAQPVVRDGVPWGSVLSFRDVRARIADAEALAAQERRWRSLILHSSDVVVVLDEELRIQFTTPSVQLVLGFTRDERIGQGMASFLHPDDLGAVAEDLEWTRRQPGGSVRTNTHRVRHADGRWLWMEATATNLLHDPDVRGIVCNLRNVTDRVVAEELLRHQATHDALTALPNRSAVRRWLEERDGGDQRFGFVLLDLDGFKDVNDALGHPTGDELLCRVADRLRTTVRSQDLVGRLGGDEFVAIAPVDDAAGVAEVAGRLLASLAEPFEIAGWTLAVSASAGGAIGTARDLDEALQQADIAMYRAKRAATGGGSYATYGPEDEQDRVLDLELTAALRGAVVDRSIDVWYQVKVDATSGRPTGVEALARWHHPVHGWVSPATFIPLAERAGLIGPLTTLVLERATAQAGRWRSDGLEVPVAVNVSPSSLRDRRLAESILDRLRDAGLPPGLLEVEITEAAVADPTETVLGNLVRLREAGARVAIDDFGTGYSSLSYLKELPVDTLKIDRSFVTGLDGSAADREIVRAICALAASLDLAVVAEGVETREMAEQLVGVGCSVHQGFLYHRPAPAADVTAELVRRWDDAETRVSP